ncbi:MAG: Rv2578c family radical SAM protein [Actinomycetota bacterium]|nr:Rv2578c family radical SAM protein [Actinomycetota bacterium]
MRWESLQLTEGPDVDPGAEGLTPALFAQQAVIRRYDTPQFRGMTFYEVQARSILNKVPEASRMPFRWTINPYRGCSHACVYCFARKTHTYLDLDAGRDFDSQVVVKVNAADLLRRELARATWQGEHVAMGTNVDCYQRAEGRYQLMRGILAALRDAANPFSILTKGTLILRDLDLLQEAAQVTSVGANVSVGFIDHDVWRSVEPGTPPPEARLAACRTLNDAGIPCGVLMAPVLPYLTDSPTQLEQAVRAISDAGARHISPIVLHLRPGAREWYLSWLGEHRPALVPRYRELYGRGSYAPKAYTAAVTRQVRDLAERYGITRRGSSATRAVDPPRRPAGSDQLTLI